MPPTVAIVGRTNVGKSTLFNRLTRGRRAITHDLPGVTRDRVAADARRPDGGRVVIVDTGGFEPDPEAPIPAMIRRQALVAVEAADAVVLVVDGAEGLVPGDQDLAEQVRRLDRPTIVAVNKTDRRDAELGAGEFTALGFPMVSLSSEHGRGIEALWELLDPLLPPSEEEDEAAPELAVAIVGRPNAGKSSILNRLFGEERVLVSEVPGTTRDAVDTLIEVGGRTIRLIDTAGIRRRGKTERGPEVLSVVMARKAIERAHVCILVVDATEGITAQDAHVAGYVVEAGRAVVAVVNKADLIPDDGPAARREIAEKVSRQLKFIKGTPVMFTSAVTGEGLRELLPRVLRAGDTMALRMGTGELNRVLRAAWDRNPPPAGKRPHRLYYATQIGSRPPRIALFTSTTQLHFSYVRFLENAVREAFPLEGVPIRFIMKEKRGRRG